MCKEWRRQIFALQSPPGLSLGPDLRPLMYPMACQKAFSLSLRISQFYKNLLFPNFLVSTLNRWKHDEVNSNNDKLLLNLFKVSNADAKSVAVETICLNSYYPKGKSQQAGCIVCSTCSKLLMEKLEQCMKSVQS